MRRRTFPMVVTAALLVGGILSACDGNESTQGPASPAGETGRPSESAPHASEEGVGEDDGRQDARQAGARAGDVAIEAVEKGWAQTKDTARQTGEALARATGEPDETIARIWEQTKDRARRAGEAIEESAAATDRVLDLAWQHAKDAARRVGEAWRLAGPADEPEEDDGEVAGEVRL